MMWTVSKIKSRPEIFLYFRRGGESEMKIVAVRIPDIAVKAQIRRKSETIWTTTEKLVPQLQCHR